MMANTHETLSFRAEISLDEAALTGRPGFGSGIRPNHHVPGRDYCVLGQIDFIDVAWLSLGILRGCSSYRMRHTAIHGRHLTIHSSRTRFAARLNSGVRHQ